MTTFCALYIALVKKKVILLFKNEAISIDYRLRPFVRPYFRYNSIALLAPIAPRSTSLVICEIQNTCLNYKLIYRV